MGRKCVRAAVLAVVGFPFWVGAAFLAGLFFVMDALTEQKEDRRAEYEEK